MSPDDGQPGGPGSYAPAAPKRKPFGFLLAGEFRRYAESIKLLILKPRFFYGEVFLDPDPGDAAFFAMKTGVLLAAGLSFAEVLSSRSMSWAIAAVSAALFLTLPFLMALAAALWAWFVKACAALLGESIPLPAVRVTVAYSTAGLLPLMIGGIGPYLALGTLLLQAAGLERGLRCSGVRAAVLTFFPFGIAALFSLFFTFLFEVF